MILHEGRVIILDEWHKWLPIIPVKTETGWKWLRVVERRWGFPNGNFRMEDHVDEFRDLNP